MKFAIFRSRLLFALICAISTIAWADEQRDAALLDELLKLPSPAPDWRELLKQADRARDGVPPSGADLATLAEFWRFAPQEMHPDPSVPARLLEWGETHPEDLDALLRWLPTDASEFHDRVKAIADRFATSRPDDRMSGGALSRIRHWLMVNSRYYRDDLISQTRQAFAGSYAATIEANIKTLARLDPAAAGKLLAELAGSKETVTRTSALVWQHSLNAGSEDDEHARQWRAELQKVVVDRGAPPPARANALEGLLGSRWPGQEEWFLGLFRDAELGEMAGGSTIYYPLSTAARADPDRWIPLIAPLVGGSNRAAHNNAVRFLASFHLEAARADALRPLLPWLGDPHWADESASELSRLRLVQSLDRVDLPESVPGLIWILGHEKEFYVSAAAEALQHYHAKGARAALKAAIAREPEEYHRRPVIAAALAVGEFSVEEMTGAILAYIAQLSTEEGRQALKSASESLEPKPLDPQVSIGIHLSQTPIRNDELVARLFHEADALAATQPESARRLREILAGWPGGASTQGVVQRLQTGDLTAGWIVEILGRRRELAPEVSRIGDLHGIRRGVQAVIAGGDKEHEAILRGNDRPANLALLACARLVRLPLPLAAVEPLLRSPDHDIAGAAEACLAGDDSPAARAAVLRRRPGEAVIMGLRMSYDPGHETFGPFANSEERLRELVRSDKGPREILALLSQGYWGNIGQRLVLVYDGKTVLRWLDGGGRQRERNVAPEELARLRAWLESHRADDLAPFDQGTQDGIQYEYVRVTRDGGRRVFMNNPPGRSEFSSFSPGRTVGEPDPAIYGRLVGQFNTISKPPMEVSYEALRGLPGFRLLHAREQGAAQTLISDQGKLLVHLWNGQGEFTWHSLGADGVDFNQAEAPVRFREDAVFERWEADFITMAHAVPQRGVGRLAGNYLWPASRKKDNLEGLWLSDGKTEPKLFAHGQFAHPVMTPDGEWVVVAKASGTGWAAPHGVVRIHVADGREQPVDLAPADNFDVIAWLAAHEKVLLLRARRDPAPGVEPKAGPDEPEYHLLDPASGALTKVTGEFQPLLQNPSRPLQPTANPNETWAAIPTSEIATPFTVIGRYDTRAFHFQPALTTFGVTFESDDMWVDERTHTVTFIVNGDVLRLALP